VLKYIDRHDGIERDTMWNGSDVRVQRVDIPRFADKRPMNLT